LKSFADFGIDLRGRNGVEVKVPCPQCSPHRKKKNYPCLNVNTDKGVWNCWHCSWSGTLKAGQDQPPQMTKVWRKPEWVQGGSGLPQKVVEWFEKRGITETVLKRNQIDYGTVYMPQIEEEVSAIKFPYFRGSEVVNIKYRDGQKNFRMHGGAERILYGLNDIEERTIWVEGEIDKLSVEMAGYTRCVSVPDGAPAPETRNYSNKFDYLDCPELDKVKTHILAVDNDEAGRKLEDELARRLGQENCLRVTWPEGCKDANEVLVVHGWGKLQACIEAAQPFPIVGAFDVDDYAAELDSMYEHGLPPGLTTGWPDLDKHYTVSPGFLTIVTGVPGHGKSEWLDGLAINLAALHGWGFGVYSPENHPVALHITKLAEKYTGKPFQPGPVPRMSKSEFDLARAWLNRMVHFIGPETPTLDAILITAEQLVKRHGIRGLILDPWNEIEHGRPEGSSETEYISKSLSKLRAFGRARGVHIWLVAHPKNLQKERDGSVPVPSMYDISGSAHWRNKADFGICVWRDVANERAPVEIHIQKVRHKHLGRVGLVELGHDRVTGRYMDSASSTAPILFDQKMAQAGDREMVDL
jgi:twinkle protein